MQKTLTLLFIMVLAFPGLAQYKYEKEIRIDRTDVPAAALRLVDSMDFPSRVRWYQEIGYDRTSFEAKTRYRGRRYSIEFSLDGSFEDLEIEIAAGEVPEEAWEGIKAHLSTAYPRYLVEKIQVQYTGDPDLILAFIRDPEDAAPPVTHYELIISAREEGSFTLLEYLFTDEGGFVHRSKIVPHNIDNIIY